LVAVISGLHTSVVAGVDAPIDVPDTPVERAARETAAEAFMTTRFGPSLASAAPAISHRFEVLRFLTDTGSVADAVGARASEVGASLVAVASHHKSRLAKLFSGSVSERLASTCPVPLVLIN
jgi:nucleotide-binding universal stress UspA family protein